MDIVLALAAALLFGVGTVLQARAARQVPDEDAMRAGLLVRLAREPVWLGGIVADALGFALQAVALAVGRIVVVQPLLATAVVFALPFGAWLDRCRLTRREILGAVAVVGGVASFMVVANPAGGVDNPDLGVWIVAGSICLAVSGVLALLARGRPPGVKASLLGSAAGILFALSAVLTKAVADQFGDGVLEVFVHWQLYALVAVGWVGMTLGQAALQTGALAPAAATQMSLDPVVSVALGVFAFDESLHESFVGGVAVMACFAVMIVGLVVLSSSQSSRESNAVVPTKGPLPA